MITGHPNPGVTLLLSSILRDDTRRETVRFYAKRSGCSCLKEAYSLMKQANGRRRGFCFGCHKKMEIKELLACTACHAVQYCSKECHEQCWPEHKELCARIQNNDDDYAKVLLLHLFKKKE